MNEGEFIESSIRGTENIDLYGNQVFTVQGIDGIEYKVHGRGAAAGEGNAERLYVGRGEVRFIQGCDGVEYAVEGTGDPGWLTGLYMVIGMLFGIFVFSRFWPWDYLQQLFGIT